jgi:hypothetical protein
LSKLNESVLILKNLAKVEYQLGDNLVLSLLLKILQPATLAIHEQQLILVDVIEMPDCLSLSATTAPLYICRPGPALETIDLDCIRPSFPQASSKESCESASMGGRGESENGRAKMAIPDALDNPNQARERTARSPLKIVFVDTSSFSRRLRLRRSQAKIVKQTQNVSCVAGYEIFGDDAGGSAHSIRLEASEDESDPDYDDDEGRNKRLRTSRKMGHSRKRKKHGKLAAADRDLLCEAQRGGPAHKLPKNKAPRMCKEDAFDLLARVAENIDWRRAVAIQHELQTTCKKPLTEFGDTNSGRKSESSTIEDTMLSDLQLKQYWSDVLVSSILDVKIQKADLEAGIAVGKKPGYHK